MVGLVMAGTATVCNRFTVSANVSKLMLVPYGNLFFDTFKFRCKTKICMNKRKMSEHDVSN